MKTLILLILFVFFAVGCEYKESSTPTQKEVKKKEIVLNRPGTIDGYDAASNTIISPINVWSNYDKRIFGGKLLHGEKVTLIKRVGDGVLVKNKTGTEGWVTYFFIKELK